LEDSRATLFSMIFSNSLTFPGNPYPVRRFIYHGVSRNYTDMFFGNA
jgi:hypothetical protein